VAALQGGRVVLSGVSLGLAPGEILGLLGENGAGKSSLLRCCARLLRPCRGRVRLGGVDLWAMAPRAVARRVAVVVQEGAADPALSVAELVALGRLPHRRGFASLGAADRDAVERALRAMRIEALADRRLGELSGGERQRASIARALAQAPDVLILDEPTNHLDVRHQIDTLRRLSGLGAGVIVALHDLNLAAAFCDRLIVLKQGRAVATGTPVEVLTSELIRRAFEVAALIDRHPTGGHPRVSFDTRSAGTGG
jgi:iron complex transport system ATP-binding protein